jgi:hypothetical protein
MKLLTAVSFLAFLLSPLQAQTELNFPQIAVGAGLETVLLVANDEATTDSVTIELYDSEGQPLAAQFSNGPATASLRIDFQPFEDMKVVLSLPGPDLRVGWMRVRSETEGGKISGSLFYRIKDGAQVLDSIGVPDSRRYRFALLQFDNQEEGSNVGLAFANPDPIPVDVAIDFYQGEEPVAGFFTTLGPNEHSAKFFTELFPGVTENRGVLVIETSDGRAIPFLSLRLDHPQLTSIPVRPYGFSLRYEARNSGGSLVETGYWMLDSEGFNLVGQGRTDTDPAEQLQSVVGNWFGTSFQLSHRRTLPGNQTGMVIFNGTSAGEERSNGEPITGKMTVLDSNGGVVSVYDFTALPKF